MGLRARGVRLGEGTRVVLTGAGHGIGLAAARLLARRGAKLYLGDIDAEALEAAERELGAAVAGARVLDTADAAAMGAWAEEVHADGGAVDLLINDAGIGQAGGLLETSLESWHRTLDVNLHGIMHGCHHFGRAMAEAGQAEGRESRASSRSRSRQIVNMASIVAFFPVSHALGYTTSKAAVLSLSLSLRAELSVHGVGVTAICPSLIDTGIMGRGEMDEELRRAGLGDMLDRLFATRSLPPERVARAILRAAQRNPPIVPIAPEAHLADRLGRLAPLAARGLNLALAANNRRLLRKLRGS